MAETKLITLDNLTEFKNQYEANISSKKLALTQLVANPNVSDAVELNTIQIKGSNYKITHKTKTSELTNDSGFITKSVSTLTNYYTKAEITTLIDAIATIEFKIVEELPTSGASNIIYLVAHSHSTDDGYDEYVYINSAWEKIGNTDIDLSDYATTAYVKSTFAPVGDIPTVNNPTITITQAGATRGSFSLNQSGAATIALTDTTYTLPTASSSVLGGVKVGSNLSISNGVLSAVQGKITIDSSISSTSTNPVQNKVIYTQLATKQATLSTAQLSAANSGITSTKVATYDGYATTLEGKADAVYATTAEITALFA